MLSKLEYAKKYREEHPEYEKERHRKYQKDNKEKINLKVKRCRANNKEAYDAKRKEWYAANKDRINTARQQRRKSDIQYKLKDRIRQRLYLAIRFTKKTGSAIKDLGCSVNELKQHIEKQWQPGMTWDNWTTDGWHMDHKLPLSSFDLTDEDQFKKAVHFTNLQPLWAKENISKSNNPIFNAV